MDAEKKLIRLTENLKYIEDIFGRRENENIRLLESKLEEYRIQEPQLSNAEKIRRLNDLDGFFAFCEQKMDAGLTPMDRVRIVRHPMRICLKDILENVYDNYAEIGGKDEYSIDPSMLIARAYITRRSGKKVHNQPVMVIGQEKGHGEEFRNGGSVKPWGNAKALQYMKVAETENIPIHTYIFTPGSYPIEDWPGAAQQIAQNLYAMAGLQAPIVAVFSEGGSGGAEAIGLADERIMLSHGYYSVISPEGAAAIEGRLGRGQRATPELIEKCASQLNITAEDNLQNGYVDRVIQEPPLGARPNHYDFFKQLRHEVISATDEAVLRVKGIKFLRALAVRRQRNKLRKTSVGAEGIYVGWSLTPTARENLVYRRRQKFIPLSRQACRDPRPVPTKMWSKVTDSAWSVYSFFRYELFKKHQQRLAGAVEEMGYEVDVIRGGFGGFFKRVANKLALPGEPAKDAGKALTALSAWEDRDEKGQWRYVSPKAREDRAVSCPNAAKDGCLDLWAPDLFGDFAGVCGYCGHHFPMEYQWYLYNVFDPGSIREFNAEVESRNPLGFEGFDQKLEQAKKKTGLKSGCMTFEARIDGVKVVCAMLVATFRGGSVGAAEGEKFVRAAERARKKHFPFLAYVHGTAGIRIQEGVNGVIQMPRCTIAVRNYIEAGGLYVVLYDTNSYAGPVASFLGCSPYQFAVRSANIGFAGPGVIKETTGMDFPPDYHRAYNALSRSHIQGIWDRREVRANLYKALMTMGGRNLYYR